jgi:hypothetical protein
MLIEKKEEFQTTYDPDRKKKENCHKKGCQDIR